MLRFNEVVEKIGNSHIFLIKAMPLILLLKQLKVLNKNSKYLLQFHYGFLFLGNQLFITSPLGGNGHDNKVDVIFNAKKLWPTTISLPKNLRPELTRVLNLKEEKLMTGRLRKQFLARLFEYFSAFTL